MNKKFNFSELLEGLVEVTVIKTNNKKTARLEVMRYVLSKFDYKGDKEATTALTPDPNVVMRYYRSTFQID